MLDEAKQTALKLAIKNKLLTITCMLAIMLILFLVCYVFFFRSVTIDMKQGLQVSYEGESGSARISLHNENSNINQRTQEFLDTIRYQATPSKNLSNGSVVQVSVYYDDLLTSKYHIEVANETFEVVVEGLPERFDDVTGIDEEYQSFLDEQGKRYLDKNMERILAEDFLAYSEKTMKLVEDKRVYRVFLKAMTMDNKDKILDVHHIIATDTSDTYAIDYYVIYDDVNDKQALKDENVYGEKLSGDILLSEDGTIKQGPIIQSEEDLEQALRQKYLFSYTYALIK